MAQSIGSITPQTPSTPKTPYQYNPDAGNPAGQEIHYNVTGQNWQVPQPQAPSALQTLQSNQVDYANNFTNSLPQIQRQLASTLAQQSASQVNGQVQQIKSANSARGLGYGGLSQGMQAQAQAQGSANLASGISNMNANLQNQANTLNTQSIETGVGIQQQQQALQNQVYQQAQADQASQNGLIGNIVSTGIIAGALALS